MLPKRREHGPARQEQAVERGLEHNQTKGKGLRSSSKTCENPSNSVLNLARLPVPISAGISNVKGRVCEVNDAGNCWDKLPNSSGSNYTDRL